MDASTSPKDFYCYLPHSDRDRQWGLYVLGAGYQVTSPGEEYPPPNHPASHYFDWRRGRVLDDFAAVYTLSGRGIFESKATGERLVKPGNVFFLFPGVWHRYGPVKDVSWSSYWVIFHGEDAERLRGRGFLDPEKAVFETEMDDRIFRPFSQLLDRVRTQKPGFQQLIATDALSIVAGALSTAWQQRTSNPAIELVRRAKAELESRMESVPVIEKLAEELNVSVSYLNKIFKAHTHLSPYEYHLQVKIHRAKHLLRDRELSVKQISRLLGFQNQYHFSKLFKEKTGMSPRNWRMSSQIDQSDFPPNAPGDELPQTPIAKAERWTAITPDL